MINTAYLAVKKILVSTLIALSATAPQGLSPARFNNADSANQGPVISQVQLSPNPYNPLTHEPVTLTFHAENVQGKTFDVTVLDSTSEMLEAHTGFQLQEGTNTFTWNPHEDLENGTYTFDFGISGEQKGQIATLQVDRPGFQDLVISNVKVDSDPYKLSSKTALSMSFIVQNSQNRHYHAAIFDPLGGLLEQWDDQPLQDGLNSLHWWGYQNTKLKPGTYTFVIMTPLGSNTKTYGVEFKIKK